LAKKVFDAADLAAVERVFASGRLNYVGGSVAQEFEAQVAERFGCRYAVAIHSAMAGLQAALAAAGVGEGDEVICDSVVPFGGYAAMYCHARPVFADVESATHNIDPESIRERITPRTKALVVTHLWGLPARIEEIVAIAREHKLVVIEDCAHALFAERSGRPVGTFGTAGVLSFQQSKHMTTGDGGLVLTDDPYIADQIKKMLAFGAKAPRLSWNFRMNELTAAVATVQFGRAEGYVAEDRRSARLYMDAVGGHRALRPQATEAGSVHSYHLWVATYEGERTLGIDQARFEALCTAEGVQGAFGYLKVPIYLHPEFSLSNAFGYDVWRGAGYCPYRRGYCPVTEDLMPRFLRINISQKGYDEHAQNAEALHRALRRLDK
jgi:dTDP-4-amino-4,6-dideoxygalactose transaminase